MALLARQMTLEIGNAVWETRFEAQRTAEILQLSGEEARRGASGGEFVPIRRSAAGGAPKNASWSSIHADV
jgi:acyl-CoA reductase-like NAD-dependent aldehyde dehydrogenase